MPTLPRTFSRPTAAAGLCAIAVVLAGGVAPLLTPPPARELSVVGSQVLRSPVADWMALYRDRHPETRTHSAMYGTGLAASAMAERRADIAPMARAMGADERSLLSATGTPVAIKVGTRLDGAEPVPFYLYIARDQAGRADAAAVDFARIAISAEGQARLGNDFAALPPAEREQALARLELLAARTTNIADDGVAQ